MNINRLTSPNLIFAMMAIFAFSSTASAGGVIYVDDDAAPGGNGASWNNAYRFLQDALAHAAGGGVDEIRAAQGLYKPDQSEANPAGSSNRATKFQMLHGLALIGGYAGIGSPNPNSRDYELYQTILSGDIGEIDLIDDNSYHVISASGANQTVVLDGLVVTKGHASGTSPNHRGGGLIVDNAVAEIVNCTFLSNRCRAMLPNQNVAAGGAIAASNSNLILTNCTFINNMTREDDAQGFSGGGAISTSNSTITGSGCRFISNYAVVSFNTGPAQGGAMRVVNSSVITLTDCWFISNEATRTDEPPHPGTGGGLYIRQSTATLTNCFFVGNRVPGTFGGGGGGGIYAQEADVALVNCLLSGNFDASDDGAGIFATGSNVSVTNCTLTRNSEGGIFLEDGSDLLANNTILWANDGHHGQPEEDQIYVDESSSATINYCNIEGWTGQYGGNGNIGEDPLFVGGPTGTWTEDSIDGPNSGERIYTDSNASFTPGEFVGNTINPRTNFQSSSTQAVIVANTATTITVWGYLYTSAGYSYEMFNYRLQPGSPSIDAANNSALPQNINTDLDGNPRYIDDPDTEDSGVGSPPIVDMGAYEFQGDDGICSNPNPDAVFVFDSNLPYLSEDDSPFDIDSVHYTLENFEDGLFNIPGVSASGGDVRLPDTHTDSVDLDDGVLDGFGADGHSFHQPNGQDGITFTFDSKVFQTLPSKVGLVWTDGNAQAVVSFTATDAKGECLGIVQIELGDQVNNGTTGEDRFLGLEFEEGISSVSISTSLGGIEIDHLQFVLPCLWDLDNSGSVGTGDLLALFTQWGTDGPADFDGSGVVGTGDLLILFANWGPCG